MFPPDTAAVNFAPSAEEAIARQFCVEPTAVQLRPELDETQIFSDDATAASFVPSEEEEMPCQSLLDPMDKSSVQVAPELLEVQILPPSTTAPNFEPSEEEAMLYQSCGVPTEFHVPPESVEVQIGWRW